MRRVDLVLRRPDGAPEDLRLEGDGTEWRVTRGGETVTLAAERLPDGRVSLLFSDGRQRTGRALVEDGTVRVETPAGSVSVGLADPLHDRLSHESDGSGGPAEEEVRAAMPGRVVEVRVAEGDRVAAGDVLLVLEAMKMQNEIRAAMPGRVTRCAVAAGDAVEGKALLLVVASAPNP
jgi:3-methylcrotonyl-CoA carboxylase alpha subunit